MSFPKRPYVKSLVRQDARLRRTTSATGRERRQRSSKRQSLTKGSSVEPPVDGPKRVCFLGSEPAAMSDCSIYIHFRLFKPAGKRRTTPTSRYFGLLGIWRMSSYHWVLRPRSRLLTWRTVS